MTSEVLWQRCPERNDPLSVPRDAWIGNGANAIITTGNELFVIDSTGKTVRKHNIQKELLEGNEDEIHWTTAGSYWDQHGKGLFFEIDGCRYWSFRTEWNRQIVIDLDSGLQVPFAGKILQRLEKVQSDWALNLLRHAVDDERLWGPPFGPHDYGLLSEIETAVLWCAIDRLKPSISLLRRLESVQLSCSFTFGWRASDGTETEVVLLMLVRMVQFALRRMGEEPLGCAPQWVFSTKYRYDEEDEDEDDEEVLDEDEDELRFDNRFRPENRIHIPQQLPDRASRIQQIRIGMPKREVVDIVGLPDVDYWDGSAEEWLWEYDFLKSDAGPHTISIKWDFQRGTILEIRRVEPGWENWKPRLHGL